MNDKEKKWNGALQNSHDDANSTWRNKEWIDFKLNSPFIYKFSCNGHVEVAITASKFRLTG